MLKKLIAALLALVLLASCAVAEMHIEEKASPTAEQADTPDALAQLVRMISAYLAQQPQALDIDFGYGYWNVTLLSRDADTIEIVLDDLRAQPISILADGNGVSIPSKETEYTYGELLDMLVFGSPREKTMQHALSLISLFNEDDLRLLITTGELMYAELEKAGTIPAIQEGYDETHFTLSITPALIETAAVRLAEQLFEYENEINSLLDRAEPLLRKLFPNLYTVRDIKTGETAPRENFSCADLKALFDAAMNRRRMTEDTAYGGMHIDISGIIGEDGWHFDGGLFLPEQESSFLLELSGDDDGKFEGMLEYCDRIYSRETKHYEYSAMRFNISGMLLGSGFSLRVRPEEPMEGFTALNIDYFEDYDSIIIDAVTDVLDFRLELGNDSLDLSAVMAEFLLEIHLADVDIYPHGSLTYRDYSGAFDSFYRAIDIELNKVE